MQDDYLDVFGDPKVFGKNIGGDISSNKMTFLLIKAIKTAKGELHEKLIYLLTNKEISFEEKIQQITEIYNHLNIKMLSSDLINKYFNKALTSLDKVETHSERKQELYQLTDKLMKRTS